MHRAVPSSFPLSVVPDSPHSPHRSPPPRTQLRSNSDSANLLQSTKMMESESVIVPGSNRIEECTTEHPLTRTRTDNEDDSLLPTPKKARRASGVQAEMPVVRYSPEAETSTKPGMRSDDHITEDADESPLIHGVHTANEPAALTAGREQSELAQLKKTKEKSRSKAKTAQGKSIAIQGRRRACDICRKRKVKCKHNLAEEAETEIDSMEPASSKRPATRGKKTSKSKEVSEDYESAGPDMLSQNLLEVQMVDEESHEQEAGDIGGEVFNTTKARKKAQPKKPKPKKATAAPAPPERNSARTRRPIERFEDLQEPSPPKTSPSRKGVGKVFDPVYITTNSNSRLAKADMYHMLLEDAAWTSLSAEQQSTLVSMLPDTIGNQQLLARILAGETENTRPQAFTMSNDCFRTDVAKFQEDLRNGHLAKTWQAAAEQAVVERAAGEYDAWKAEEAESWWGQNSN